MEIRFRWLLEASGSVSPFVWFVKPCLKGSKNEKVPAKVPARTPLTGLKLIRKDMPDKS
jgi:hypothetical protein